MTSIAIALHLLAATTWVGGMFFAYQALRPAALELEPPQRLSLWVGTFSRFFPWVWGAIILLPLTGLWMIFNVFGGMGNVGPHVHIMLALGIVMILIFLHVFFAPYRRLKQGVKEQNFPPAAGSLAQIRRLIGLNLIIGLITIAVASGGRFM